MSLLDSFLNDAVPFNLWIAARSDGISGSGTVSDPFNGSTRMDMRVPVTLSNPSLAQEALAVSESPHGLINGDVVMISGVEGGDAALWNGTFVVYDIMERSFKYWMKRQSFTAPEGVPVSARLTFLFDEVMRQAPAQIKIHIGPGIFQTRGFAANDARGWQPKTGQNIVGMGVDVTTLQLVGAENADQHYHVVGMPIESNGSSAIEPLKYFEISDLTIDCNVDGHSGRPNPGYANVACGAVRVFGDHARIRNVKAINWGTKSLKQGCFVLSVIQANASHTHAHGYPILTETQDNGIEECICIQPFKNNARETTVLHLGGVKNVSNHAQGFGTAGFIRKNFVDCQFLASTDATHPTATPFSSHFITSKQGTGISTTTGTFVGKRPHFRIGADLQTFVRFYNPKNPASRWNGYFPIIAFGAAGEIFVGLDSSLGTNDDSSFVIMGTELRAVGVSSGINCVVEQNQIHNCWIGGPYQSPMDAEAEYDPEVPPTLAREERLDPLNALHNRSLIVRDNFYREVAVGPYLNAGGRTHYFSTVEYDTNENPSYGSPPPYYLFAPPNRLWVWPGAPILVEWQCDQHPNPPVVLTLAHEVTAVDVPNSREFYLAVPPQLTQQPGVTFKIPSTNRNYWRIFGTDFLIIEGNQIWLSDLDATEFALKEYPLAATPAAQKYRPYGLIVADNELAGGHAHRQVFIRNNKIQHVDNVAVARQAGLGAPAAAAMQLAGVQQLHVTHNVVEVNAWNPMRAFRCETVRFFNNTRPDGTIVPGGIGDSDGRYDEPETLLEDAFVLSLLLKRRRTR